MQHQALLILATALALSSNTNAEGPSFEDGELELLEIEIVESVCGDGTFRNEIGESTGNCAKKALSHVATCTNMLYKLAPRADAARDAKRLDKAEFAAVYASCLKDRLRGRLL